MKHTQYIVSVLALVAILSSPFQVQAAEKNATLVLRPACPHDLNDTETVFGPIPDVEGYVTLADEVCPSFFVEDPQTLRTNELRIGDILEIDIVIENPSSQPVHAIRSWLSYDPGILEGVSVSINKAFPTITPGESDFDTKDGFVMIEASNNAERANAVQHIRAATIVFRVIATSAAGTPLTFYDVQPGGHTHVTTTENDIDQAILEDIPGSLKVAFAADTEQEAEITNENAGESASSTGFQSLFNNDEVRENTVNTENTTQTESPATEPEQPEDTANSTVSRTAFSLLQVRNLRLTTDGSSLYIGWDALNHQDLKAYNIYYGTTSGRYIQRKTILGEMNSLVLRALPVGTTYYVAIRAVSTTDEETAFSQEVSVEIGKPNTSTSPLLVGSIPVGPNGVNPVQGSVTNIGSVPGETGTSSTMAWLVLCSALIGTFIAARRQSHGVFSTPASS